MVAPPCQEPIQACQGAARSGLAGAGVGDFPRYLLCKNPSPTVIASLSTCCSLTVLLVSVPRPSSTCYLLQCHRPPATALFSYVSMCAMSPPPPRPVYVCACMCCTLHAVMAVRPA